MRKRYNRTDYYFISVVALLIISCNLTKNVPKGDALYTGATIKVKDSTLSKKEKNKVADFTEHLPRPKPNSKFLGIPFKLILYNLSGDPKKKGFIRKFLRKLGEPPVLLSNVNLEYNVKVLKNNLENVGYFRNDASGDTTVKKKKAHATYTIEPGPVYTIKEVTFVTDSSALGKAMLQTKSKTLLHPNDPFNFDVVKGERLRIDAILKEEGYYYFSPDFIIVNADTTKQGDHQVNMYVMVKENTANISKKPYIIDDVFIYPNYRLNSADTDTAYNSANLYNGLYIVDPKKIFKPKLFPRILRFDSGDVYNRKDHNLTLSRLINLDVFKFVKNRFELSPNSQGDTGRLNTYYYLTPLRRKSLRVEVGGNTRSGSNNNSPGSNITFSWTNRNLLRGAEHLTIHANVGTELQYSSTIKGYSNTYRAGGGFTFTTPRFVVPFFKFNTTSAYVPRSKIELGYDLLNRSKLYTLNSFKAELGYVWKPNQIIEHQFNLFSINYVLPLNITQAYRDGIGNNPILQHVIDTQFIIGTNYTITVDHLVNDPKGTGFYFNGLVDISGNTAGLVTPVNSSKGKKTIIGVPFDQYFKTQADVRYYYAFSTKMRVANRVIAGFGYPYGNSRQIPFIKQFFIGGNNSLRGFRSRSVGPGTYLDPNINSNKFFPDESGDIKLELNTELRFKLNKILEPAIFIDAGNIWLYNKDTTTIRGMPGVILRPGVQFTKDFLNELAVDAGVGLRIDLAILLLRLDIAAPLHKPWLPSGQRWVPGDFNFKNAVFNLAIGYPF
ncbi:MAG: BamA/TamA family outer membrane protein [Ginsengibacter sp.]